MVVVLLGKNIFLFLGRLSEEKGYCYPNECDEKKSDCQLKIVGAGPLDNELNSYKIEHHLDNVEFLGFKSGQELVELKRNAYFVIVPSEWYEK